LGLAGPPDLAEWGLHCFCLTARQTPHSIVRLDDNGRLLYRAVRGVTVAALRNEGFAAGESQIRLLQAFGLLRKTGDRLATAFPVLGSDVVVPLRGRIADVTHDLAEAIAADAAGICTILGNAGHAASAYAVVFGYALDGLLWRRLARRNVLPATRLGIDHPFWRGAFWAVHPERVGAAGTNETEEGRASLVTVWTAELAASLRMTTVIGPVRDACRRVDDEHDGLFASGLPVPVVKARRGDLIHRLASRIAAIVARFLLDPPRGRVLLGLLPGVAGEVATVIVAHELIWDLMARCVANRIVPEPSAFASGSPTAEQLRSLMFIKVAG
jgi:hypothetical protein